MHTEASMTSNFRNDIRTTVNRSFRVKHSDESTLFGRVYSDWFATEDFREVSKAMSTALPWEFLCTARDLNCNGRLPHF